MRVQKIDYNTPFYGAQKSKNLSQNKVQQPMHDGLSTAGAWFGFGVALDFVSRKCHFSKSPTKNSLLTNGIIATGAGIFTIIKEKKFDSNKNL